MVLMRGSNIRSALRKGNRFRSSHGFGLVRPERLSLGFFLGWIPALILALLVVVATIFLWPLVAVAVLYVIYRVFGVHPELLIYIAAFVGIIAIVMIWWWHVANNKS